MTRILFTSDLHLTVGYQEQQFKQLSARISEENPDVLAVSGDVADYRVNVFGWLGRLGLPVVFCLGNHEFVYRTVDETLERFRRLKEETSCFCANDVHCLDTEGHFDALGCRFYGNVLWYDGTLYNGQNASNVLNTIDGRWLDSRIVDFRPVEENRKCIEQIKHEQRGSRGKKRILLTHCVPARKLNLFDKETPLSVFNCYSGMENLFDWHKVYPDISLCGHTHRRVVCEFKCRNGREIRCWNSGNDYFPYTFNVQTDLIEV